MPDILKVPDATDAEFGANSNILPGEVVYNSTQGHYVGANDSGEFVMGGKPVTNAEVDAGTETTPRGWSPASVKRAVDQHAASASSITTALDGKQPLDATLTALAGLSTVAGVLRQSGADAFTKDTIPSARRVYFSTDAGGTAFDDVILSDVKSVPALSFVGNNDTTPGAAEGLGPTDARALMFGGGSGFDSVAGVESDDNVVIYDTGSNTIEHATPLSLLSRALTAASTVGAAESDDTIVMLDADGTPQRITPANLNVSGSVKARRNSTGTVLERSRLNLIEGTGISLTVGDDSVNNEIDVTIAASSPAVAGFSWSDRNETAFTSGTVQWVRCPAVTIPANTLSVDGKAIYGKVVGFLINNTGANQVTRFGLGVGTAVPALWDDTTAVTFSADKRVFLAQWTLIRKNASTVTAVLQVSLTAVAISSGVGSGAGAYGALDNTAAVPERIIIQEDFALDCTIANDIRLNVWFPTTNVSFTGSYLGQYANDVSGIVSAANIANNSVTNAALVDVATGTMKGRITAGTGDLEDLNPSEVRTILNIADGATAAGATGDAYAASHATATGAHGSDAINHSATIEGVAGSTVQAALNTLRDNKASGIADPVIEVTGTTWSPTTSTQHALQIRFTNASSVAITLPSDATQAIVTGRRFTFHPQGAGGISIAAGPGAFYPGGVAALNQNQSLTVVKSGSNTWRVMASSAAGAGGGGGGVTYATESVARRRRSSDLQAVSAATVHNVQRSYRGHSGQLITGINVISRGNTYGNSPFTSEVAFRTFCDYLVTLGASWISLRMQWGVVESGASAPALSSPVVAGSTLDTVIRRIANLSLWAGRSGLDVQFDFHTLFNSPDQSVMAPTWLPTQAPTGTRTMMNIWDGTDTRSRDFFAAYQRRSLELFETLPGWENVKFVMLLNEPYLFWGSANQSQLGAGGALWKNTLEYVVDQARSATTKPLGVRFLQDWNPEAFDSSKRYDLDHAMTQLDVFGTNAYGELPWFVRTVDETLQEGRMPTMIARLTKKLRKNGKSFVVSECGLGYFTSWDMREDYVHVMFGEHYKGIQPDGIFYWVAQPDGSSGPGVYPTDDPDNSGYGGFIASTGEASLAPYAEHAMRFGAADRAYLPASVRVINDTHGLYGDPGRSNEFDNDSPLPGRKYQPCSITLSSTTGTATATHGGGGQPFAPSDLGRIVIEMTAAGASAVPGTGRATMTARASTSSATFTISSPFSTTNLTKYESGGELFTRWRWGDYKLHRWAAKRRLSITWTNASQIAIPGGVFYEDDWIEIINRGAAITFAGCNGLTLQTKSGGSLVLGAGTTNPTIARITFDNGNTDGTRCTRALLLTL